MWFARSLQQRRRKKTKKNRHFLTNTLIGNTNKAKRLFGFKNKTNLDKLIKIMMDAEMKKLDG